MTDRREGTPDPEELATPDEVVPDGATDAAAVDEAGDAAATDVATVDDGDVIDDGEVLDDLLSDAEAEELEVDDYEAALSEVAAANAGSDGSIPTIPVTSTGKRRAREPAPARAPTASEIAVHVREDVSKVFVIVAVGVFVVILLNGMLLGTGGLLSPKPTPSPSIAPSASASAPASASPGASASSSPSAAPSASAPASAPAPSPSASVAPSP